jgi:hypothetical protein
LSLLFVLIWSDFEVWSYFMSNPITLQCWTGKVLDCRALDLCAWLRDSLDAT